MLARILSFAQICEISLFRDQRESMEVGLNEDAFLTMKIGVLWVNQLLINGWKP